MHNSFNVFMKTLNVNEVCQVRVNSRNLGFIQTWENNTKSPCSKQKRNMTPLFWVDLIFECYKDDMVFRVFIVVILVRTSVKKRHLDENGFRNCYGNFFRILLVNITWSQLGSKSLLNSYEAHWQQHFEWYPTAVYFTDMDQHAC